MSLPPPVKPDDIQNIDDPLAAQKINRNFDRIFRFMRATIVGLDNHEIGFGIPIEVIEGGTGLITVAQGDILYGSATNVLSTLPKSTTATRYLSNTGTSNNPAWAQVDLSNGVTGDLPYANIVQGTALSLFGVAGNATADHADIVAASDAQVMRRSGSSIGFGQVDLSSGSAVGNTLRAVNGGTGFGSYSQGDILYADTTSTLAKLNKDTGTTRYLSNTGASNNPAWAQVSLTQGVSGDLPFSSFVQATAASKLVGRGSAGGAGDFEEITVGSGLTMTATTLSATGGGSWSVATNGDAAAPEVVFDSDGDIVMTFTAS